MGFEHRMRALGLEMLSHPAGTEVVLSGANARAIHLSSACSAAASATAIARNRWVPLGAEVRWPHAGEKAWHLLAGVCASIGCIYAELGFKIPEPYSQGREQQECSRMLKGTLQEAEVVTTPVFSSPNTPNKCNSKCSCAVTLACAYVCLKAWPVTDHSASGGCGCKPHTTLRNSRCSFAFSVLHW